MTAELGAIKIEVAELQIRREAEKLAEELLIDSNQKEKKRE